MFTGIVEERGQVVALADLDDACRLTVRAVLATSDVGAGDSIAVNGCCLTVTGHGEGMFVADAMRETLDKTSLGALAPGSPVNLERAVPAGGRLGGHLVQGHVDGTGTVLQRSPSQHWDLVRLSLPHRLAHYVADKGSIAVDGVSLTVVEVDDSAGQQAFTVGFVPATLTATTLGTLAVGDVVNLEVDVLAKYVERLLAVRGGLG